MNNSQTFSQTLIICQQTVKNRMFLSMMKYYITIKENT